MAKAEKVVIETRVHLDISMSEAEALRELFCFVAGDPRGRRGLVDNVAKALNEAGVYPEVEAVCEGKVTFL